MRSQDGCENTEDDQCSRHPSTSTIDENSESNGVERSPNHNQRVADDIGMLTGA